MLALAKGDNPDSGGQGPLWIQFNLSYPTASNIIIIIIKIIIIIIIIIIIVIIIVIIIIIIITIIITVDMTFDQDILIWIIFQFV